ncbi:CotH kinase family protein [Parabacteroides sp. AM08-6]|uniref:CotH kinase family protein n=1 Tax=Parabacteroides sp. AM08-6 TaxID=2292053 RepID=UPI000EFF6A77|nr:CotH kinase family protein [Parabacteroides sp. AM08-6]RHJ76816.1 T9SS C-terminal target domain-containing protein [Parabacteroides sp. AM08-6]
MKKLIITVTSLLITTLFVSAQNSEPLKGTVIGSEFSADYSVSGGAQSTTVNTKNNAFDNDLNTFFAAYDRTGGWAGLDLGKPHIIKQIAFAPRKDFASRLELGIFEGANEPDFIDAIPLYIIKETPKNDDLTTVDIQCSRGFRYVRYVGPNDVRCNIAEIKFFGEEGEGDDKQLYQLTGLPVVTIHTKGSQDIIEKEVYLEGKVSIISENGSKIYTGDLDIRGRGNSSWGFPKKPYRMKLNKKTKLLDFPADAKNWTLINNYGDKTLMRNLLAFEISKRFKMRYTPAGRPVDVILNGEYKGCYQLCDHMEVKKNRIDITEMAPEDISYPALTGGYLIEIDAYANQEISWFKSSMYGIPVTIKSPKDDEIVPEQSKYIKDYFNKMESLVFSPNYNDPEKGYRSILDTESFLKHFLIGEFCGNTDTYWSVYMTKDRDEDKFYTGPVWDFDIAFDNDQRTYPINSLYDFIFRTKGSCADGMRDFADRIIRTTATEQKNIWSEARLNGDITLESLNAFIDKLAEEMDESQQLNFKRWPILNEKVHENPMALGSFKAEVNAVKSYLKNRIEWMDKKVGLNEPPTSNGAIVQSSGQIYVADGQLHVSNFDPNSLINIYDLTGRKVGTYKQSGTTTISLASGLYIISVSETNTKSVQQKIQIP